MISLRNCVCCSTSKLFMKLKHGLCPDCYKNFVKCQNDYEILLDQIKNYKYNTNEIIAEINVLMIKLKKFDNATQPLKSSDCLYLLDFVNDFTQPNLNKDRVNTFSLSAPISGIDNNVKSAFNSYKDENNNNIKNIHSNTNMNNVNYSATAHNSNNVNTVNNSNNTTAQNIINSNNLNNNNSNTLYSVENNPKVNATQINNGYNQHPNDTFQAITLPLPMKTPETKVKPTPLETYDLNSNKTNIDPLVNPIKNIISPELYDQARDIVKLLTNPHITVDELCYNALLLKNTYLPLLRKNNILEIDNINISNLIDSSLSKASLQLHMEVQNIDSYYNYVAFSLQTTGAKIENSNIVEIGAVKVSYGKIEDTFYTLVNPLKTISHTNEMKLNLSNANLSKAPTLNIVLEDFLNFIGDLTLVSHNSSSNFGFLKYNYDKILNYNLSNNTKCSMKLYRKRFSQYYGDAPKRFSLIDCCNDVLINQPVTSIDTHNSIALTNALATYNLYEILKKRYK